MTAILHINPLTAQARKSSGLNCAHIHACKQHIGWACNKPTFTNVQFGRSPFTCSCEERKNLNDFKFGTFVGRSLSDGATSKMMMMK